MQVDAQDRTNLIECHSLFLPTVRMGDISLIPTFLRREPGDEARGI